MMSLSPFVLTEMVSEKVMATLLKHVQSMRIQTFLLSYIEGVTYSICRRGTRRAFCAKIRLVCLPSDRQVPRLALAGRAGVPAYRQAGRGTI
jgi:hypothetical protein